VSQKYEMSTADRGLDLSRESDGPLDRRGYGAGLERRCRRVETRVRGMRSLGALATLPRALVTRRDVVGRANVSIELTTYQRINRPAGAHLRVLEVHNKRVQRRTEVRPCNDGGVR
jgi:hypothetical protein